MIIMTVIRTFVAILFILNYIFRLSLLSSSGSANAHLLGCFRPWKLALNIGLHLLPSDSFMPCFDSVIEYSTEEFRALQLIVLVVMFGAVNQPLACYMLVHVLDINFEMIVGL